MDNSRFEITSKQLIFIIVGAEIATGILSLPRVLSTDAGHHAWLAVIIGVIVPLLAIYLIVTLLQRFSNPDFVRVSHLLFGKILGSGLVLIFIVWIIFFEAVVVRIFAEVTKVFLLPKTPLSVIILLVVTAVFYAISQGGRVVGRLNEILFWILLIDLLILLAALPQADYTYLLPLNEIDYKGLIKAAPQSFYSYAGLEILLVIYAMVVRKGEVLKAAVIGQLIVMLLYLSVVLVALLVFGCESLEKITWPLLTLLKVEDIAVIERLELLFLVFWLGIGARPAINLGFAAAYSCTRLLPISFKRYYLYIVGVIVIIIYAVALIPADMLEAFKWADYAGRVFLFVVLGFPVIYHIAAFLRKGRVRNENSY